MTKHQIIKLSSDNQNSNNLQERKIEDYLLKARELLTASKGDAEKQTEAISEIATQFVSYNDPFKMMRYIDELAKDFKIKKQDFNNAIKQAKPEEKKPEDQKETSALVTRVEQYINKRYDIYFNVVANKFMYRKNDENEYQILNEHNIYRELQKAHIRYSMSDLKSLLKSDFVPHKNIFIEYFKNLPAWDGEDHIENLSKYFEIQELSKNSNERDRFSIMFKKMFVRSIACSLEAGYNKQCFTIVGPEQNLGKSSFFRWLCPPKLEDYYTENIGTSKDDLIALTENFIVNIDELSTLSKYDINALKTVMSKHRVKVRLPYGERPELLQRRCNFVASTNRTEFLNDETGSVRWVCFWVKKIRWQEYIKEIDINKVWSQAYHLFKNTNYNYQLTQQEEKESQEANKTFFIRTPEMELIQKYMNPSTKEDYKNNNHDRRIYFMTATDILTKLQQNNISNIKLVPTNIGKSLVMLGFTQSTFYNDITGMSLKGYYVEFDEHKSYEENENENQKIENPNDESTELKEKGDKQCDLPF